MKLVANAGEFTKAVAQASKATAPRAMLKILNSILITNDIEGDNIAFVEGTNLETSVVSQVEAEGEYRFCVPAQQTLKFLSSLNKDEQITITEQDQKVTIECGKISCSFPANDPDDFPQTMNYSFDEDSHSIILANGKDFTKAIKRLLKVADDKDQEYLRKIVLRVKDYTMTLAATNAHCLSVNDIRCNVLKLSEGDVLIPTDAAKVFCSLHKGDDEISINAGKLKSDSDDECTKSAVEIADINGKTGFTVYSMYDDHGFPNVWKFVKDDVGDCVIFDRKEILSALKQMKAIVDKELHVVMNFDGSETMTMRARDFDSEIKIEVGVRNAKQANVSLRLEYLYDTIDTLKDADCVGLVLNPKEDGWCVFDPVMFLPYPYRELKEQYSIMPVEGREP